MTDRITVLKNSRKVATLPTNQADKHTLVELMIGSEAKILQQMYESGEAATAHVAHTTGQPVLTVSKLSQAGYLCRS
ncbi:MAG: hypothetical protein R2911_24070 [Caldilineaceae bacterium]